MKVYFQMKKLYAAYTQDSFWFVCLTLGMVGCVAAPLLHKLGM